MELKDGQLGLVVGDATGKGVPAALVMASARSMLRAVAQASDYSPGDVLRRVNDSLVTDIPPNMFVTCLYAILDTKSGHLVYANAAGHDLPYLWHGRHCEELGARGIPLGLMAGMRYEEGEVSLRQGNCVLFYSDGLVEAHDPKGEMFGFPRLPTFLAAPGEEQSLEDFLLEVLYPFVGGGLGAGGRHPTPYPGASHVPKLNFREFAFHALGRMADKMERMWWEGRMVVDFVA